jgi:site-specific DNA recombinase
MYVDKLDGKVDAAFFDRMSAEWCAQQDRCLREIERHQAADRSYLEEGVRLLELARNSQRLFEKQEPREKRRLLNFVVSNCTWKGGELVADLRQPFDLLAETTAIAAQAEAGYRPNLPKTEIWLPLMDSNHDPRIQSATSCR